ncbi:hypothetical protein J2847_004363 [Azospirillum agricola]|uniref:hypothetical protein n=1 Tax=Azospirillum agricola TaxID=1720247 RepID=UPI001AE29ACA|nr:hypothetical protein [Azospirillum agricola]MBP2231052.1 hypothetical protein [Azospirillum agricola]
MEDTMPTQTPPNALPSRPHAAPWTVGKARSIAKLETVPLNRWAGMPAMSGFFRSGDPFLDLRDRFDHVFDSAFYDAVCGGLTRDDGFHPPSRRSDGIGGGRLPAGRDSA